MRSGRDIAGKRLIADDGDTEDIGVFRQVGQEEGPVGFADGPGCDGGILPAEDGNGGGRDGLFTVGHFSGEDRAAGVCESRSNRMGFGLRERKEGEEE